LIDTFMRAAHPEVRRSAFPEIENMRSICVYCGSNSGSKPAYAQRAAELGARIASEGLQLVYGGGNVGLMGIVADAVLAGGGEVTGVIPEQLVQWEVAHKGVTRLEVVANMHERKARMFDLADAFVALPGGFGTLDEMFEMLTWRQLGLGKKPCAFLDVDGFYAPLIGMIDRMVEERFLHAEQRHDLWHGEDIDVLFAWMRDYTPAQADKWLDEKRRRELR
jgi:uncharacterized protein (TIGR00730 family)